MEETPFESSSKRRFAAIDLMSNRIPDETMILTFRHLLEKHGLGEHIFGTVKTHHKDRGVEMGQGTFIDATLITSPNSTKSKAGDRDPEIHQTGKGKQ